MGGRAARFFTGAQSLATVDDLDAFARRAEPGEEFVYCEAPDLIRSPTSIRAGALAADGLVRTHSRRRAGGGWQYYVVRTRYKPPREPDPQASALADLPTALIYRDLKRAAFGALRCPPDTELARKAGLATRNQAQWRFRKLLDTGLIGSELVYDGGVPFRVVTIEPGPNAGSAAGKRTALPGKWIEK